MRTSPLAIVLGALFLAYPLLVYCGLTYFEPSVAALMVVLLALSRFALAKPAPCNKSPTSQLTLTFVAALVMGLLALVTNSSDYLRFYPVCINALMFVLFFNSLLRPPSIVERIARGGGPGLSEAGVRYTRNVTKVWCSFFIFNGALALYTGISSSLEVWALYNGIISYVLIALLFTSEYLVRSWCRSREFL